MPCACAPRLRSVPAICPGGFRPGRRANPAPPGWAPVTRLPPTPAHIRQRPRLHTCGLAHTARTREYTFAHAYTQACTDRCAHSCTGTGSSSRRTRRRWAALRTQATCLLCDGGRCAWGWGAVGQGPGRGPHQRGARQCRRGLGWGRGTAVLGGDVRVQPHPSLPPPRTVRLSGALCLSLCPLPLGLCGRGRAGMAGVQLHTKGADSLGCSGSLKTPREWRGGSSVCRSVMGTSTGMAGSGAAVGRPEDVAGSVAVHAWDPLPPTCIVPCLPSTLQFPPCGSCSSHRAGLSPAVASYLPSRASSPMPATPFPLGCWRAAVR